MKETASGNDQQLEMILPHNVGLNSFDSKLSVQRTSGRNIALRGCTIPPKPDAMGRSPDQLRDASPPGGARGPVSPQSGPAGPGACPSGAELTQGVGREERRLLRCLLRRAPPPDVRYRCAPPPQGHLLSQRERAPERAKPRSPAPPCINNNHSLGGALRFRFQRA